MLTHLVFLGFFCVCLFLSPASVTLFVSSAPSSLTVCVRSAVFQHLCRRLPEAGGGLSGRHRTQQQLLRREGQTCRVQELRLRALPSVELRRLGRGEAQRDFASIPSVFITDRKKKSSFSAFSALKPATGGGRLASWFVRGPMARGLTTTTATSWTSRPTWSSATCSPARALPLGTADPGNRYDSRTFPPDHYRPEGASL